MGNNGIWPVPQLLDQALPPATPKPFFSSLFLSSLSFRGHGTTQVRQASQHTTTHTQRTSRPPPKKASQTINKEPNPGAARPDLSKATVYGMTPLFDGSAALLPGLPVPPALTLQRCPSRFPSFRVASTTLANRRGALPCFPVGAAAAVGLPDR